MTTVEILKRIEAQTGPQRAFQTSAADIAIYGGAAGGGKSWALLMEPLRHIKNPDFGAVIFRRTTVQIRNEGGLWDESRRLYWGVGGAPREHDLWWKFPSGAAVTFAHLEHDKNVHDYQGAQIPLIGFDEICHFTEFQFWYMVSRNRSMCGVRPYIRATCNPDADSWVADFISWWIDQDTGYPIHDRAGVLRWFVRIGEKIMWADEPAELAGFVDENGDPIQAKSATFIPSRLTDNKALMEADPGYMANLMALPPVERERLLKGNWKVRWAGIDFFPEANWLVNGLPIEAPKKCDMVFGVIDSAAKTGKKNDSTFAVYFAYTKHNQANPLVILGYDCVQIEGALLESWLPSQLVILEDFALKCGARGGSAGVLIEDKSSGEILNQQARRRGLKATPIDSRLTALGKEERALSISGYHHLGKIKITEEAFNKVVTLKGATKNHLLSQVTGFRIGDPDADKRADDGLDCYCYGVSVSLGDNKGF